MAALKADLVCLPIIDWRHRFQRPQQLARLFARAGHRVFFAELTFGALRVEPLEPNVFATRLPGPAAIDRFRQRLSPEAVATVLGGLERLAQEQGLRRPVLLVQQPFWAGVAIATAQRLGWRLVFDCMDEHEGLTVLNPEMLTDERELAAAADLVVVSAQKLWAKHVGRARRLLMLPNATDYDHFSAFEGPAVLADVHKPIIGYYGAIMEWFDVAMVEAIARAHPDWTIVLIGNVDIPVDALRACPNVQFLGEKLYAELPAYLHRFDVCLIPFRLVPIIQATNPVKFYEYLSAGKPVVATRMPELVPFESLFYTAESGAEAVAQIERALAHDTPARVQERQAWARTQSWQARFVALQQAVEALDERVSIIIVSYQNLEHLRACLASVETHTDYGCYEVIVVDNNSAAEVRTFLQAEAASKPWLRVIQNDANVGFAKANNQGIAAVSPDCRTIVLLNNDTVVTPGWLRGLLKWLRDGNVGMVGPVTWPPGVANEAAIPVTYDGNTQMLEVAAAYTREHQGESFEIPYLAMFCVALRREVVEQVGGLDEAFGTGMFEDDDYAMRLRQAGYRVLCARDVFVHHVGSASFKKLDAEHYRELFARNKALYEAKWGVAWRAPSARINVGELLRGDVPAPNSVPASSKAADAKASIVIINYNGKEHFDACLQSLRKAAAPAGGIEILVIDNASVDGSVAYLEEHYPEVRVVRNAHNLGFAKAANLGAEAATGTYVVFLNNDMRVERDWLTQLLAAFDLDPKLGSACSFILDWEGAQVDFAGRPDDVFALRYEKNAAGAGDYAHGERYLLALSGGALAVPRELFLRVGGFDPSFFMYHEDVDLGWRLWAQGYRNALCPSSVVYHRGGASSKKLNRDFVRGLGIKHALWTVLKNAEAPEQLVPLLLSVMVEASRWDETQLDVLAAVFEEAQAALSSLLAARLRLQAARQVSDAVIFAQVGHPLGWAVSSPQFRLSCERIDELCAGVRVDWRDPTSVRDALMQWLRAAVSAHEQLAPMWRKAAAQKHQRTSRLQLRQAEALAVADGGAAVTAWGPRSAMQGRRVNLQPSGFAAFWVRGPKLSDYVGLRVGDTLLEVTVSLGCLSASVPADKEALFAKLGSHPVALMNASGDETPVGIFVVRRAYDPYWLLVGSRSAARSLRLHIPGLYVRAKGLVRGHGLRSRLKKAARQLWPLRGES